MSTITSQITSLTIVYSTNYSGADQSKHQSSASLAFVWGIHRGPVNSPHKWPVTRKMFPFDDVIMRMYWSMPEPRCLFSKTLSVKEAPADSLNLGLINRLLTKLRILFTTINLNFTDFFNHSIHTWRLLQEMSLNYIECTRHIYMSALTDAPICMEISKHIRKEEKVINAKWTSKIKADSPCIYN